MNKWIALGNLGRDPEIRVSQSGKTVARFSLAVARRLKRDGGDNTDWFNCVAFGKTAEFVEKYLHKGSKVVVDAEVQNNNYEKDGVMHYGTSMVINSVEFAESKKAAEENGSAPTTAASADDAFMNVSDDVEDDSIPFS